MVCIVKNKTKKKEILRNEEEDMLHADVVVSYVSCWALHKRIYLLISFTSYCLFAWFTVGIFVRDSWSDFNAGESCTSDPQSTNIHSDLQHTSFVFIRFGKIINWNLETFSFGLTLALHKQPLKCLIPHVCVKHSSCNCCRGLEKSVISITRLTSPRKQISWPCIHVSNQLMWHAWKRLKAGESIAVDSWDAGWKQRTLKMWRTCILEFQIIPPKGKAPLFAQRLSTTRRFRLKLPQSNL